MPSRRLPNSMETDFCLNAQSDDLQGGVVLASSTPIGGSQFTNSAFTLTVTAFGMQVSPDGHERWMNNVFIERRWRSLKRSA